MYDEQTLPAGNSPATGVILLSACNNNGSKTTESADAKTAQADTAGYFLLRPELEKAYGYSHAVRIGDDLKISGAVSMNDSGMLVAPGNMEQQMKNCYSDQGKILEHYGYTFDDVVAENIYTTNMKDFIHVAGFRNSKKLAPLPCLLPIQLFLIRF